MECYDSSSSPEDDVISVGEPSTSKDPELVNVGSTDYDVTKSRKRGKKEWMTPKLVATLDACKVSERDAIRILFATAEALGHDVSELIINRNSISRCRKHWRKNLGEDFYKKFSDLDLDNITVHWDGKMLPALTSKEKIDRLSVIIDYSEQEQLLGIPSIPSGSGENQADAIFQLLEKWQIKENVQAFSFDTTASNTGRYQGCCVLLEQKLERDILYLPCRHHIYEIILKTAFDSTMGQSSGPNVQIFNKFQESWSKLNKEEFTSGVTDEYVKESLPNIDDLLNFAMTNLKEGKHPREDYRELLELMIIFLGGIPLRGISFRIPGAFHHARWMSKAIYCLKIFIFRNQFFLSHDDLNGIKNICIFIVRLYVKAWIRSPFATEAPLQDLQFLGDLYLYKDINEHISRVALLKFCNHLWYLSPEASALAFFDNNVPDETKILMVQAMTSCESEDDNVKKISVDPKNVTRYLGVGIENFISKNSRRFFDRLSINTEFLEKHPSEWIKNDNFRKGLQIAKNLKVVNDAAERGVKLMQDYNNLLTTDEEEKQFILQIVREYRSKYPNVAKSTLSKNL